MARRRLTPVEPGANVPRAEHSAPEDSFSRISSPPPIAHIAADAVGAAALQEMADRLERARKEGRLVLDLPIDAIHADHLARDRIPAEDSDMLALRESIRAHGQRTPIEVTPLTGALPYGLISGWRRLQAIRALHSETGEPRFSTISALLRAPETVADAYVAMVEENEVRVGLSYYERARVAALAAKRGVFETEKEALLALFATASRPKRSRIRAFIEIYHALDGVLRFPTHLPERLGLKLVELVRASGAGPIATAIDSANPRSPEEELTALSALVAPPAKGKPPAPAPVRLRPDVVFQEDLRGCVLSVKFTGKGVTPELRTEILGLLDRLRA